MFECDFADMCADKFPLVSMGGRAEGPACADPVARTPICASENFPLLFFSSWCYQHEGTVHIVLDNYMENFKRKVEENQLEMAAKNLRGYMRTSQEYEPKFGHSNEGTNNNKILES